VEGKKRITPYWRTLRAGGVVNDKYPGGLERQKNLLEAEGHAVVAKGKKYVVADYERRRAKF
jgi:alkylated DNA nucleotide flippase Atl1